MKYWFKNVADNIYIYPKSAPRNLILQTRTSDCNSAHLKAMFQLVNLFYNQSFRVKIKECKTGEEIYKIIEQFEYETR